MSVPDTKPVDLPNGERIAYREREGGEIPLVLLHGNMSSSAHWDVVFERMDDRFALYAMDIRGFGDSSYENPADSIAEFAEDVPLFADAVGLDDFHLWGWSAGSAIAMQVAADVPDRVRRLVLMAPPSTQGLPVFEKDENLQPTETVLTSREELANDPVSVAPVLSALETSDAETMKEIWSQAIFVNEVPDQDRFDRYIEETLQQRCLLDIDYALVHFNISTEDNGIEPGTGEVTNIDSPTLVLRGEDDLVVSREMSERVTRDIEDARYVELEGCGHAPTVDDPERLLSDVEAFLTA
ncbi:alpha/beta fold hydrolase [Salinibaculum rarum]|uniref:intracellular short-chain-length polyhydroxyalkanoate depolymerase n=1 Tax=Salinibaculum rarum TaxID=3058903 RepID=UPI00265D8E15|nr:alpha/beta hydrolase [Salinibaculum sp. KK48]